MTISDRVFELLKEKKMSQKEFSEATGIAQSTISDWRKKSTNPSSDKIMIICDVLGVTPYYLLSGIGRTIGNTDIVDYTIISHDSEDAVILQDYHNLDVKKQQRVIGYIQALKEK